MIRLDFFNLRLKFIFKSLVFYVYECSACMNVCIPHVYPIPVKLPCESWDLNLDNLQEQQVFFTTEPSP